MNKVNIFPKGTKVPRIEAHCPVCGFWQEYKADDPPAVYDQPCARCKANGKGFRPMIILRIS